MDDTYTNVSDTLEGRDQGSSIDAVHVRRPYVFVIPSTCVLAIPVRHPVTRKGAVDTAVSNGNAWCERPCNVVREMAAMIRGGGGRNVNHKNKDGHTALQLAEQGDMVGAVNNLLSSHAKWRPEDRRRKTSLRVAVECGCEQVVWLFCAAGVDTTDAANVSPEGKALLFCAVENAHLEVVRLLLDYGVDPSVKCRGGVSALHVAARYAFDVDMLELLLDNGVDVNTRTNGHDTALGLASHNDNLLGMTLLLERGADVNAKDVNGNTPLHSAIVSGYPDMIRVLLDNGANMTAKNQDGVSVVHGAALRVKTSMITLIEYGANIEARDQDKRTPFLVAVEDRNTEVVDLLIAQGADVTIVDMEGNSAIHFAARDGDVQLVETLIGRGMDVCKRNFYEQTPWDLAVAAEDPLTDGGEVDHSACEKVIRASLAATAMNNSLAKR